MFSKSKPRPAAPAPSPASEKSHRARSGSFPVAVLAICFFCIWLVYSSVKVPFPQLSQPPCLFSNPSAQDLRITLIEAIRKARFSIFLVMFGLSDPPTLSALADQAGKGVAISGFYDPKGSPNLSKILKISSLSPLRQPGLMHQKILILDNETVFLGSANFTTPSLKMHDNLVVGLSSRRVAHFLKERAPKKSGYLRTLIGGQDVELWLLPDPKGHALSDLKRILRSASHSIKIALFTLTHGALSDELIRAKKRGIQVTVAIDFHSALGASASCIEKLKKNGIEILFSKGVQLLHHKFAYIDQSTLVCGSANWTKAAFAKNSDCLIALHQLNDEQKRCMNQLWSRIRQSAQKAPLVGN